MTDADVAGIMSGYKLQDGTAVTTVALLREYVEENLRMNKIQNEIEQYFIDNVKLKRIRQTLSTWSLETNLKYVENEATAYNMDLRHSFRHTAIIRPRRSIQKVFVVRRKKMFY